MSWNVLSPQKSTQKYAWWLDSIRPDPLRDHLAGYMEVKGVRNEKLGTEGKERGRKEGKEGVRWYLHRQFLDPPLPPPNERAFCCQCIIQWMNTQQHYSVFVRRAGIRNKAKRSRNVQCCWCKCKSRLAAIDNMPTTSSSPINQKLW